MAVRAEPAVIPGAFSGTDRRADFPVFERPTSTGKRLVYLDSSASSPKAPEAAPAPAPVGDDIVEEVTRRVLGLPPIAPPGTRHTYSNVGWTKGAVH